MRRSIFITCISIALTGGAQTVAAGNNRLALVVANANYGAKSLNLSGPPKDAEVMAAALEDAGFDVEVVPDATKKTLQEKIAAFKTR